MTKKEETWSEAFYILKKSGADSRRVLIRRCAKEELSDIIRLQKHVHDTIAHKDVFVLTAEEELAESLASDICLGAYNDGCLIAFTLIITTPDGPRNIGRHLNYGRERCRKCVTYDTTFVHPSYTGYGLQSIFLSIKNALAARMGACEALATVSPDNTVSLNNLKAAGFEIAGEKTMYGERRRYIMRKSLV
ncbi:MAG: hypothetical protein GX847_00065 [Clostridiales bacterium]|nr:hypothetical protein [Clostridiales bacterium]